MKIWKPEELLISGDSQSTWGADQEWYNDARQRRAGCGPTTCANLIWYLSKVYGDLKGLFPNDGYSRMSMLGLMEELWLYITPGNMGVNSTAMFAEGAAKFSEGKGLPLSTQILDVPASHEKRPSHETVKRFLIDAISHNLPIAFLNLSCGALGNLESWHWVTLISLDEKRMTSDMVDQGRKTEIDLDLWLRTTDMGGGFVVLAPVQ